MTKEKDKKISLLLEDISFLESYIHDLFVFSPLPICFINPLNIILEANPAFEKIANFAFGEIIGETIEKLFDKEEIKKLIQDTLEQGFVEGREIKFFPKKKESIFCQVFTRNRTGEESETTGCFLAVFDLTKIKKPEEELKKAEIALLNILEDVKEARKKSEEEKNKTLAIINNFTDGLLVFNAENKLSFINSTAEGFFNLKTRDVKNKSALELVEDPNLGPLIDFVGKEIQGVFRKEMVLKNNLILEVSTISMTGEEKNLGNLIILHDITREKLVERIKTEFVSLAAHQLRTPLSAIKWTLKMLLDGDLGEINKEQREFIEKTYVSNERMISLINDLLDVTRIEEGRYVYRPVLTDLEPVVQSAFDFFQDEVKKRKLKMEFKKPENKLPKVMIDVEKIGLVIQNLIENAVKYSSPEGQITISLKGNRKEIECSVTDNGVGIPKDQQERVFTKFFRGVNVRRMDTEGSGLGLFITKNIVEAHGGRIWFKSEEKKETTFFFTIPAQKEKKRN